MIHIDSSFLVIYSVEMNRSGKKSFEGCRKSYFYLLCSCLSLEE